MNNLYELGRFSSNLALNNSAMYRLAEALEKDIQSRDRVDISLKEYENMKGVIDELIKENENLKKENANYKDILRRCQLPVDIIVAGKVKEVVRYEDFNPVRREQEYAIKLTVAEEDLEE